MAFRISLNDFLTPRKFEESKRDRCDSEASTTPSSTPEARPRLILQDHINMELLDASDMQPAKGERELGVVSNNAADLEKNKSSRKPLTPGIPSRGSKNHCIGKCRPCRYFQAGKECPNGVMCNFCHLPHREILRKVTPGRAFLTSETKDLEGNTQCAPCLSVLAEDAPWYIQLPRMHLSL